MPPFSFLTPWFLVGAAAAAVPVVLHLFARETATTVPFSAVHLLEATPVVQSRRRRLTDLLLLALRMAVLALLALAFARPYLASVAADHRRPLTVVALDMSASMGAPATWASAKRRAQHVIDAAPAGSLVAVTAFSGGASVVTDPTTDRAAAHKAVEQLTPGAGPTRLGSALELARALSGGQSTVLTVVSDLPASIRAEASQLWLPEDVVLRLEAVEPPPADLYVTAVRRTGKGVSTLIESEGAEPRETTAVLRLDGEELTRRPVSVEPHGLVEVSFDAVLPSSGVVSVLVEDPGGRLAGDERFLVLDARPASRIVVVEPVGAPSDTALYVKEALSTDPSGAFSVDVRSADDPSLQSTEWTASTGAVVLLGTRGLDRRSIEQMAAFVRRGGGLLIAAGPLTEALAVRDLLGEAIQAEPEPLAGPSGDERLVVGTSRHPFVLGFGEQASALGEVRLLQTTRLTAPEEAVVLRLSSGRPALVERPMSAGRVIVFASDLSGEWNDFPKHAAFVPFLAQAVRTVAAVAHEPDDLEVAGLSAAEEPGVVALGSPSRRVAVNVSADEFDQPTLAPSEVESMVERRAVALAPAASARHEEEERSPLWPIAMLAALVLLIIEGFVAAARGGRLAGEAS